MIKGGLSAPSLHYRTMAPITGKPQLLLCSAFIFFFFIATFQSSSSSSTNGEAEIAGYGYNLQDVKLSLSGDLVTANLALFRNSDIYGPDIRNLRLTAR